MEPTDYSTLLYLSLCWNDAETGYRVGTPICVLFEWLPQSYLADFGQTFWKKRVLYKLPKVIKIVGPKIILTPSNRGIFQK